MSIQLRHDLLKFLAQGGYCDADHDSEDTPYNKAYELVCEEFKRDLYRCGATDDVVNRAMQDFVFADLIADRASTVLASAWRALRFIVEQALGEVDQVEKLRDELRDPESKGAP